MSQKSTRLSVNRNWSEQPTSQQFTSATDRATTFAPIIRATNNRQANKHRYKSGSVNPKANHCATAQLQSHQINRQALKPWLPSDREKRPTISPSASVVSECPRHGIRTPCSPSPIDERFHFKKHTYRASLQQLVRHYGITDGPTNIEIHTVILQVKTSHLFASQNQPVKTVGKVDL